MKISVKRLMAFILIIAGLALLATVIINVGIIFASRSHVYTDINAIPPRTAVLVLGSQTHGTRLSPVLQDRVDAAIRIIENRTGEKLILSGDSGGKFYDEVNAMWLYVLANAPEIPEENIFLDYAGFSTWESMYRASYIFEVDELIIVTQQFHISRAVIMARSLGINALGYGIYQGRFRGQSLRTWTIREYFARVKAFYSIIFKPEPQFLGEKIPISGDGRASWK